MTEDISKLRNTVGIYSQTGARVRTVSDAESAALYGPVSYTHLTLPTICSV